MVRYDIEVHYINDQGGFGLLCTSYNLKKGGRDAEEHIVIDSWLARMSTQNRIVTRLRIREKVKGLIL